MFKIMDHDIGNLQELRIRAYRNPEPGMLQKVHIVPVVTDRNAEFWVNVEFSGQLF